MIQEIAGWLDRPGFVALAMASRGLHEMLRGKNFKKFDTSWLVLCASSDYVNLLYELSAFDISCVAPICKTPGTHIYRPHLSNKFLRGFSRCDSTQVCLVAAVMGAPRMTKKAIASGALVDSTIVRAALESKHLKTLKIVLAATKSTLKDYTFAVVATDGLLWIPKEMLTGVHRRIMKSFPYSLLQSCQSIATLEELNRLGAVPPREYISATELSRGVLCELILTGEKVPVNQTQLLEAIEFSLARNIINLEESLQVFLGVHRLEPPTTCDALEYLRVISKHANISSEHPIVNKLTSVVQGDLSKDWK